MFISAKIKFFFNKQQFCKINFMGSIYKKINPENRNTELVIKKYTGLILLKIQQTGFIIKIVE